MMTTRKQKRVWTTLIVVYFLVLAEAPLVYGQNFAPPSPTQESTVDIKNGSLSTNNFVSLEKASAINLLENKSVTGFFSKNFTINGQVGELENGAVIDDWAVVLEKLKNQDKALINQNITSDQVKTAYESWFRQQRSRRDQFVGDGGGAVQQKNLLILIKESFDFGSGKNPQLKDGTVLKNSSDWESWARKQGLPAAGLALMALYGTVRRRRELEEKEYDGWSEQFKNLSHGANFKNNREYNRIYQNISRQVHTQKRQELLNSTTQKYRNWSSQFRAFWRDQRAKAGLAVQESTQLKKIITTVKTAFATRQNKSRQQLETKTLNFYASKSKMLNRTFEESRLQKQWDS
jgi:hypothetical protein